MYGDLSGDEIQILSLLSGSTPPHTHTTTRPHEEDTERITFLGQEEGSCLSQDLLALLSYKSQPPSLFDRLSVIKLSGL